MKFLVYGESWEGTLPSLLLADLKKRGYDAKLFDFTDFMPGIKRRSIQERLKRRVFIRYYIRLVNRKFLNMVLDWNPDVVVVSKGIHLKSDVLMKIKTSGIYLVNWNPDDFFNPLNSNQDLITSIPIYDLLASCREHRFDFYKKFGAQDILFLESYYISNIHHPELLEKTHPISFVGSWSPSRENFISNIERKCYICGSGWEKSSSQFKAKHLVQKKVLSQREMVKVFSSSRFNLNILTHENFDYVNMRFFEVTASGGLLLTEQNDALARYLDVGKEVLTYSSVDDVNQLLNSDVNYEHVAAAGRTRIVSSGNRFEYRVDALIDKIDRNIGGC